VSFPDVALLVVYARVYPISFPVAPSNVPDPLIKFWLVDPDKINLWNVGIELVDMSWTVFIVTALLAPPSVRLRFVVLTDNLRSEVRLAVDEIVT
jgi:hypothetical protein